MRLIRLFLIIISCCVTSCVEPIDIKIEGVSELLAIDAMVTDYDSVQTVYIRRECESLEYYEKYPPFENASVYIKDDNGWGAFFEDQGDGRVFKLSGHQFEPGRTYTISINVDNKLFEATEKMVPLPVVEGMKFYPSISKDGEENWNPILYFKDNQPEVDNYYLFAQSLEWIRNGSQNRYVPIQILSDVGLRGDMDGVDIELGMGAEWQMSSDLYFGERYSYNFLTISKSNYDYFAVMQSHIENDGGVYKPTPTSPATNFSGKNVQGQFIAASRKVLSGRVSVNNIVER